METPYAKLDEDTITHRSNKIWRAVIERRLSMEDSGWIAEIEKEEWLHQWQG